MITIYFGLPRSGKSTLIVRSLYKAIKYQEMIFNKAKKKKKGISWYKKKCPYDCFYTNMSNTLAPSRPTVGLGKDWVYPDRSLVLIDEAGIEYNSRKTLSLPQHTIEYLKLHGHYKTDIQFYSQTWEDIDVTIRRLAERYYYIRRLGPFTLIRRIKRVIMINDEKQIVDGFEFYPWYQRFLPFPFKIKDAISLCFRPKYYKYFDSYSKMGVEELNYNEDKKSTRVN